MQLSTIQQTLIDFASNPNKSWGESTDAFGKPGDINAGHAARVMVHQSDRNTARLSSGTYTEEQLADFNAQLVQVEQDGSGTAYFPGEPEDLPDTVAERTCSQCGQPFRSAKTDYDVKCYKCVLDRLCPPLPGLHVQLRWQRDDWRMEASGNIGFRNELIFWWSNHNSGGNVCHQGLVVHRNQEGVIRQLIFSTVASNANCTYTVTFDLEADTVKYSVRNTRSVQVENLYHKSVEVEGFDIIVLDLIEAMMPSWMLYVHRPRNPANGCFATA